MLSTDSVNYFLNQNQSLKMCKEEKSQFKVYSPLQQGVGQRIQFVHLFLDLQIWALDHPHKAEMWLILSTDAVQGKVAQIK